MKNKKEHKQSPPPSHMCFIHVLSSQVAPISPDAGVRDRIGLRRKSSEHVCLPFGLRRCLQSSANNPLTFLRQTVEPVLALRQHPRKTGPIGRETWSLSPNWWLDLPTDVQLPVNLLSTSTLKTVFLKASSWLAIRQGRGHSCKGTSFAAPCLPAFRQTPAHSGVGLHQSGMKHRHQAHSPPLLLLAPRLCALTGGHKKYNLQITLHPVYLEPSLLSTQELKTLTVFP